MSLAWPRTTAGPISAFSEVTPILLMAKKNLCTIVKLKISMKCQRFLLKIVKINPKKKGQTKPTHKNAKVADTAEAETIHVAEPANKEQVDNV